MVVSVELCEPRLKVREDEAFARVMVENLQRSAMGKLPRKALVRMLERLRDRS